MTKDGTAASRVKASERRLTTSEVVRMVSDALEWRCESTGCDHALRFQVDQIEAIAFFIVRHMLKDHGMTPEEVVEAEPSLAHEVEEYCREMGREA